MSNRTCGVGRLLALTVMLGVGVMPMGCTSGSGSSVAAVIQKYVRTNLVASKAGYSDGAGTAAMTDANLVNPWGIAFSANGPFWIADNGSSVATAYDGIGSNQGVLVNIASPGSATGGAPTGQVFNGTADFKGDHFIFSTEDGTIVGWNSGASSTLEADRHAVGAGAVYKGLALGTVGANNFLFATNFRTGNVDVFDKNYAYVKSFTDTGVDAGFAPFGIQAIGTQLFVTFAKQDNAKHDDVGGAGNGFVDIFNTDGTLVTRFASHGSLNSPWAIVQAPAAFGQGANAILIGNFGDGHVSAFSSGGTFLGQLEDTTGTPMAIPGLWGLSFGNGSGAGSTTTLYFTAGVALVNGGPLETAGLFGAIALKPPAGAR